MSEQKVLHWQGSPVVHNSGQLCSEGGDEGGHGEVAFDPGIITSGNCSGFLLLLLFVCFVVDFCFEKERVSLSISGCPGTQSTGIKSAHHHA